MQTHYIHPDTPQPRLIDKIATALATNIIVCPTTTGYRLITGLSAKTYSKLTAITQDNDPLAYPLLFTNVSQLAHYATLHNAQHRLIKANIKTSIAFILPATKSVPKALISKDKTICGELVQGAIIKALLETTGEPVISYPLYAINGTLTEPYLIDEMLGQKIDDLIDVGTLGNHISTVLDIQAEDTLIVRSGDTTFDKIAGL